MTSEMSCKGCKYNTPDREYKNLEICNSCSVLYTNHYEPIPEPKKEEKKIEKITADIEPKSILQAIVIQTINQLIDAIERLEERGK
jgi:ferredoxin